MAVDALGTDIKDECSVPNIQTPLTYTVCQACVCEHVRYTHKNSAVIPSYCWHSREQTKTSAGYRWTWTANDSIDEQEG